jgi:hypothetical protein
MSAETVRENVNAEGLDRSRRVALVSARPAGVMLVCVAALVGSVIWLVWTARRARPAATSSRVVRLLTIDRPFPAEGRFANDPYIGPKVCAECHPGEAALHSLSGHARTLSPAGRRAIARRLNGTSVADPELPDVLWSYRFHEDSLYIARKAPDTVDECIAEYALGSGRHAMTFVSMIDPDMPAFLEHRLTYYTRDGVLALTPGHDAKPPPPGLTVHGGVPPSRDARSCFACHATQLAATGDRGIDEKTMIPNVSCERCHGPGRAHVAAARRGAPEAELALPLGPGRWSPPELLRFCGECHRHPAGPRPDQIRRGDPNLARFQPIGIAMSKCYQQTGGKLSCLTCHDPHARASSNRVSYDPQCLNCHGDQAATAEPTSGSPARTVACPVSPRAGCVECHMPRVDLDGHLSLTDHWIRIRQHDPAAPKKAAIQREPPISP